MVVNAIVNDCECFWEHCKWLYMLLYIIVNALGSIVNGCTCFWEHCKWL